MDKAVEYTDSEGKREKSISILEYVHVFHLRTHSEYFATANRWTHKIKVRSDSMSIKRSQSVMLIQNICLSPSYFKTFVISVAAAVL